MGVVYLNKEDSLSYRRDIREGSVWESDINLDTLYAIRVMKSERGADYCPIVFFLSENPLDGSHLVYEQTTGWISPNESGGEKFRKPISLPRKTSYNSVFVSLIVGENKHGQIRRESRGNGRDKK